MRNSRCLNIDELFSYLNDKVSESSMEEMNNHINECELCVSSLERIEISGMSAVEFKEFNDKLVSSLRKSSSPSFKINRIYFSLAASIVLVLGVWFAFGNGGQPSDGFANYYSPYEDVVNVRASGGNPLSSAMSLYNNGEYSEALPLFAQNQEGMDVSLLYQAICLFEIGDSPKAIAVLKQLIEINNPLFTEQAKWYLALFYIKEGNQTSATQYLNDLVKSKSSYREKAQVLLDK